MLDNWVDKVWQNRRCGTAEKVSGIRIYDCQASRTSSLVLMCTILSPNYRFETSGDASAMQLSRKRITWSRTIGTDRMSESLEKSTRGRTASPFRIAQTQARPTPVECTQKLRSEKGSLR